MEEWRVEHGGRSLCSVTECCARREKRTSGSLMRACQKGQASIVLLFGFHSIHLSTKIQKRNVSLTAESEETQKSTFH